VFIVVFRWMCGGFRLFWVVLHGATFGASAQARSNKHAQILPEHLASGRMRQRTHRRAISV
jgi:hypothetical protein